MPVKDLFKKTKISYKIKYVALIVLCVLFIHAFSVSFSILAETPSPDSVVEAPEATSATATEATATESTTAEATLTPTPTITATEEPNYLYDFTAPPYNNGESEVSTLAPDVTEQPGVSDATIDVVKIDNIEQKRGFRWSDLIKYLAYGFFALAVFAIAYGLLSMAVLIFFKKDITFAGIKKRKMEKQKKGKSSKNKK